MNLFVKLPKPILIQIIYFNHRIFEVCRWFNELSKELKIKYWYLRFPYIKKDINILDKVIEHCKSYNLYKNKFINYTEDGIEISNDENEDNNYELFDTKIFNNIYKLFFSNMFLCKINITIFPNLREIYTRYNDIEIYIDKSITINNCYHGNSCYIIIPVDMI